MKAQVVERRVCWHCGKRRNCWPWGVKMCADGRKKRDGWLCFPCDKTLNGAVLHFFRVDGWKRKVAVYRW